MTGYKHRIIDKLINKFDIFFSNSNLHTFNFLFLLYQRPLHHRQFLNNWYNTQNFLVDILEYIHIIENVISINYLINLK